MQRNPFFTILTRLPRLGDLPLSSSSFHVVIYKYGLLK